MNASQQACQQLFQDICPMVTQKQLKRAQYNDVQTYNDAPSNILYRQDTVALKVKHLLSNQGT